jgi:pimeloyl-ACP methyl ester carboxylesterase
VAPSVGPVGDAAPLLARTFGPAAPVRVAAVDDPPVLAPAGSVAGLIGLVMRSDDWPGPDGTAPAPSGTVTVQRLDHADGTRSWVVAIPGTQTWLPGSDNTLDGESDLQVLAGAADSATAGVLGAMAAAGIPDDEPVVLVGHSLGGMVAMSVAAVAAGAGAYRVGAVVTAGSPTVARAVPAAVPVIRLEHDEDAIPQLDGEPTRVAGNVTRVGRAMGDTVYAHGIEEYRTTARLLDEAAATAPGSAPAVEKVTAVLGGQGTAATTTQYRMTRTDVATSSPASAGSGGGR